MHNLECRLLGKTLLLYYPMSIKGFLVKEKNEENGPVTRAQADQMIRELRWISWGLVKIPLIIGVAAGLFFLVAFISMKISIKNQQQQGEEERQIIDQKR